MPETKKKKRRKSRKKGEEVNKRRRRGEIFAFFFFFSKKHGLSMFLSGTLSTGPPGYYQTVKGYNSVTIDIQNVIVTGMRLIM